MSKGELKQPIVDAISEDIKDAESVVLVDYRGLTVEQDTRLRKELREAGVTYKVYKNTLMKRAFEGTEFEGLEEYLAGPSAIAVSKDDATAPARIICKFAKEAEALEVKGGVVEGTVYDVAGIAELSKIPSREELLGKLLGSIQSPITNFARVLNQLAEQGGALEAAPAEETKAEEPVAEAAPAEEAKAEKEAKAEEPVAEAAPEEEAKTEEAEAPAKEAKAEKAEAPVEEAKAEEAAAPAKEAKAEEAEAPAKEAKAEEAEAPAKEVKAEEAEAPAKEAKAKKTKAPAKEAKAEEAEAPAKEAKAKKAKAPAKETKAKKAKADAPAEEGKTE